jgi:outer membrane protein assembly factor BamB
VDALAVATDVKTPGSARGVLLRLIPAVIAGALAGIGTLLCIRNLWTAAAQAHAHCDGNGLTARPCTTGLDTVLAVGLICAVPGVPAAIGYAVRGRWANRAGMVAAGAVGLLAGQAIFGAATGTDLPTAWSVPATVSTELGTIGSMQFGDSVIWVRTDKAVSYDAATGQRRWSLAMPRGSVACAVSDSGAQVGLIGYGMGQPGDECSGVLAVDLATGHRLWSAPLPDASDGVTLLVTGDAAVIVTDDDLTALWAGTGAPRWTLPSTQDCAIQQADATEGTASSPGAIAALIWCGGNEATVADIDAATGHRAWTSQIPDVADRGDLDLLSADPVVVTDWVLGNEGSKAAVMYSASGRATTFPIGTGDFGLQLADEGFNPPPVVIDGMLVGVSADAQTATSLAGYRLSDGRRLWDVSTSDDFVNALAVSGDQVYFTDQAIPALFAVSARSGTLRSIGTITGPDLDVSQVTLYPVGRHYILVNSRAYPGIAVLAAITS